METPKQTRNSKPIILNVLGINQDMSATQRTKALITADYLYLAMEHLGAWYIPCNRERL